MDKLFQLFLQYPSVCTDTRKLAPGDIFFALKGANFNGNLFAQKALEAGAIAAVVDEDIPHSAHQQIFRVNDVLTTLQQLAAMYRQHLGITVIALTGSNGKTTTKELIAAVLLKKYKLHYTQGNLNNEIGVPLTLLSAPPDTQMMVIEMGANHQGEIHALCEIAQPDFGMITNIGLAHLEGFGGPEGVKKGKSEMYRFLERSGGKIFLNTSDSTLVSVVANPSQAICYASSDYKIAPGQMLHLTDAQGRQYATHLVGAYNTSNVVAAIAIGRYFGVGDDDIKEALEAYVPSNNRSQKSSYKGTVLIKDAYNANPSSMESALNAFFAQSSSKSMVILGDMLELGDFSGEAHLKIIRLVCSQPNTTGVFIGPNFYALKDEFPALFFLSAEEAKLHIPWDQFKDCMVLMKGSRGIALEKLLD